MESVYCSRCHAECRPDGIGTGYAALESGEKICYDCAAAIDRERLLNAKPGDKFYMYLVNAHGDNYVTNCLGTLKIRVYPKKGRHNIACYRYDVWFAVGKNSFHGVNYGENTQICHVKCLKYKD